MMFGFLLMLEGLLILYCVFHLQVGHIGPGGYVIIAALGVVTVAACIYNMVLCARLLYGPPPTNLLGAPPVVGIVISEG